MADKSEEEYLNDLLKELMEGNDAFKETDGSDSNNTIEQTHNDATGSAFSEESDDPEITPIISESNNEFQDLVLEDSAEDITAADGDSDSIESEIIDEFGSDFFSDLQGIISSGSSENTKVDENAFRKSIMDEKVNHASHNEEFSDIFSMDEGMTIDDIPDEHTEDKLTDEELSKISGLMNETDNAESNSEDISDKSKKRDKKKREKREKREKKRESKAAKQKKNNSEDKPKSKKSFKDFITLFDDEEETDKSADDNQELINELYNDKKTETELKENKPKKAKKVKPPKEKKKKAPKKRKNSNDDNLIQTPVERVYIDKVGVAIITALVLVFLVGGYFGVSYLNYKLTINSAKNYYNICNYTMAYDELTGIDIKSQDEYFYEQVRILMIVNQGNDSYNNFIELDMETEAINALINAVGRKQLIEEQAEKYNVTDRVNVVYQQILTTLNKYGIDEARALDLYRMNDYEAYYKALDKLGGLTQ